MTGINYNDAVQIVLNIARAEIGYHEKASNDMLDDKTANSGNANFTKYARDLDNATGFYNGRKNGYDWCDIFSDWVHYAAWGRDLAMQVLCQPERSAGAGCSYSARYYLAAGRWFTSNPQPGDQIFFYSGGDINHTGIVEFVTGGTVTTIEGNCNGMVMRRSYDIGNSYIAGYGRPRYELITGNPEDYPRVVPASTGEAPQESSSSTSMVLIRKGNSGESVRQIQEKLMKLGYDLGVWGADGDFGDDTMSAVLKFQTDNNLEVDGIVGTETLTAIDAAISKLSQGSENQSKPSNQQQSQTPTQPASSSATPVQPEKKEEPVQKTISIGDIVMFNGKKHYRTAFSKTGLNCKPGKAKVTGICAAGNAIHIYHLVRIIGSGSTVFGWVDASDVEVI